MEPWVYQKRLRASEKGFRQGPVIARPLRIGYPGPIKMVYADTGYHGGLNMSYLSFNGITGGIMSKDTSAAIQSIQGHENHRINLNRKQVLRPQ
jgi:hypothetical protein